MQEGSTAIQKASERGRTAIVKILLADPGIQRNLPDKVTDYYFLLQIQEANMHHCTC